MNYKRIIRIIVAILTLLAMVFLFVDASGWGGEHLGFLARVQFMPALLALNVVALLVLVALTLIFGRIYCSVICPLGIMQDVVSRIRKATIGRKRKKVGVYHYKKPHSRLRVAVLAVFAVVIVLGALNVMAISLGAIIEPYSAFGRIVTAFVSPLYDAGNNVLADATAESGSYLFTPVHRSVPVALFIIAGVTLIVVTACAWRNGRIYCNSICPVGTILGYASKFSWLKIRIDTEKCNSCGSCARHCKAGCIDSKNHEVDYTRCVDCFDCLDVCRQGAIKYIGAKNNETHKEPQGSEEPDGNRRVFVATLAALTGAAVAKAASGTIEKVTDGGLTPLKSRSATGRKTPLLPPGVISQARLNARCVGCQLCIQACPSGLLSMSTNAGTLMQPVMNYTEDYCPPYCQACSNVCPTGVFTPLDEASKSSLKIGTAQVNVSACLSANGTDSCGNCSRHCPVGAIEMVSFETKNPEKLMPVVKESVCIGCGACEVHCPVGTVASMSENQPAIHVEGVAMQRYV